MSLADDTSSHLVDLRPNGLQDDKKVTDHPLLPPPHVVLSLDEVDAKKKAFVERIESMMEHILEPLPEYGEFGVRGWARGTSGGLTCTDLEQLESQKGVMTHLVKSFGSNLIQGKSVVNVSLPVRIFEPRSFLQRIPDAWCFAPIFLTRAAFAETPLQRFQHVITFMVAGLHHAVTNTKPFNPILGETFEGSYKDGSQIFLEQTSHHPPISSFQLIGPNGIYHVHGSHEFAASLRPNSILGSQIGLTHVDFLDGTRISFHLPAALVRGTILGDRNFTWVGNCRFTDEKNHLFSDVKFNPDEKSAFTRLFGATQRTPDDHIRGEIFYDGPPVDDEPSISELLAADVPVHSTSTPPNMAGHAGKKERKKKGKRGSSSKASLFPTKHVSLCEGSWMDGIGFTPQHAGGGSGETEWYWTNQTIKPFKTILSETPLPSDCRFREDLIYLIAGNLDEAQKWKSLLEERQRAEREQRKKHDKVMKKRLEDMIKVKGPPNSPASCLVSGSVHQ